MLGARAPEHLQGRNAINFLFVLVFDYSVVMNPCAAPTSIAESKKKGKTVFQERNTLGEQICVY